MLIWKNAAKEIFNCEIGVDAAENGPRKGQKNGTLEKALIWVPASRTRWGALSAGRTASAVGRSLALFRRSEASKDRSAIENLPDKDTIE